MRRFLLLACVLALSGCSVIRQPAGMIAIWGTDWRRVVTSDDRERLRDWRTTFTAALNAARKGGHSTEIDREGALLDPDSTIAGGAIPNGLYRCHVIKLGAKAADNLDYMAYPATTCRIGPTHAVQRLDKLGGSQRYSGVIFPNDAVRGVFLGTLVLGDETRSLQYGQDEARDVAGYVERIGSQRWRLVMPKPHFESQLDVMELTPLQRG